MIFKRVGLQSFIFRRIFRQSIIKIGEQRSHSPICAVLRGECVKHFIRSNISYSNRQFDAGQCGVDEVSRPVNWSLVWLSTWKSTPLWWIDHEQLPYLVATGLSGVWLFSVSQSACADSVIVIWLFAWISRYLPDRQWLVLWQSDEEMPLKGFSIVQSWLFVQFLVDGVNSPASIPDLSAH